jgi:hypothetical protein
VTLGDFETVNNRVIISNKNKEIKIQSNVELIDKVMVFDVSGKLILEKKNIQKIINIFRYKCTKTAFYRKCLQTEQRFLKKSFIRNQK